MIAYLAQRLLAMCLVALGVSVLTFLLAQAIPGDPARAAAGPDAPEVTVRAIRRDMGLDKPLAAQYVIYLQRLGHGDLGRSIATGRGVVSDLLDYYPATLELTLASIFLSCLLGVPAGVRSALRRGHLTDQGTRILSLFAVSMPIFWLGLIYQLIFYGDLKWLPAVGRLDDSLRLGQRLTGLLLVDSVLLGRPDVFLSAARHLVLPVVALSGITVAEVTRITRAAVLEVLPEQYVTAARAKGLRERAVLARHVLRNALVPVLTVLGLRFGHNLGGAVLVETIFSWPGVGRYAVQAIENKDFPGIMGVALTMALLFSLVNLAVDVAHAWNDPRLRYG